MDAGEWQQTTEEAEQEGGENSGGGVAGAGEKRGRGGGGGGLTRAIRFKTPLHVRATAVFGRYVVYCR